MCKTHSHTTHTHRSVPQTIPLSEQGQSSDPTYETISTVVKVKGDYAYTQNEAYQTVSEELSAVDEVKSDGNYTQNEAYQRSERDSTTPPTERI